MPRPSPALLCLLWLSVVATASRAEEPPATLRVALSGEYMPLHGTADGGVVGLEADIARLMASQLRATPVFVDTRRTLKKGAVEAVAAGEVDIALNAITPTPERGALVDFTSPYVLLRYRLAARPGTTVADLKAVGGRVAGTALTLKAVAEELPSAQRMPAASGGEAVQLLLDGKADFVADEEVGLAILARKSSLELVGPPFGVSPLAIAVPKGWRQHYEQVLFPLLPDIERRKQAAGLLTPYELTVFLQRRDPGYGVSPDSPFSPEFTRVEAKVKAGVDLNTPGAQGLLPLEVALAEKRPATAHLLLRRGARLPPVDTLAAPARDMLPALLVEACGGSGDLPLVKQLLASGVSADARGAGPGGRTALMEASRYDNTELIQTLLASKASLEARDKGGRTALSLAVMEAKAPTVRALLAAKADPRTRDEAGRTPLHWLGSSASTDPAIAKLLLAAGAEVDAPDAQGATPLHGAVVSHPALVPVLLDAGAALDARDAKGRTPLVLALAWPSLDAVELLLSRGARPDTRALQLAISCTHPRCAGLPARLIQLGADVNGVVDEKTGDTALHLAARFTSAERTNLVLGLGARTDVKNADGETPLHVAAASSPKAALRLIDQGAELDARDAEGTTPLLRAVWSRNMDVVRALVEKGADLSVRYPHKGSPEPLSLTALLRAADYPTGMLKDLASILWDHVVRPEGAPLRDAPALQARVLATVPFRGQVTLLRKQGAPVDVAGATGRWTRVAWQGQEGWMLDTALTSEEDLPPEGLALLDGFPLEWDLLRKNASRGYVHERGCTGETFLGILLVRFTGERGQPQARFLITGGPDSVVYRLVGVRQTSKNTRVFTLALGNAPPVEAEYRRVDAAVGRWSGPPFGERGTVFLADRAHLSDFPTVCRDAGGP